MDLERLMTSMPAGSIPSSKKTLKLGITVASDRLKPTPTAVLQIVRFFRAQIEYWQESSQMTIADILLRIRRRPFRVERQRRPRSEDGSQIRRLVHRCG